jgi:hypothetical protein
MFIKKALLLVFFVLTPFLLHAANLEFEPGNDAVAAQALAKGTVFRHIDLTSKDGASNYYYQDTENEPVSPPVYEYPYHGIRDYLLIINNFINYQVSNNSNFSFIVKCQHTGEKNYHWTADELNSSKTLLITPPENCT